MQNDLSMQGKSSQVITDITRKHKMRLREQRKYLPYIVYDYLLYNCCAAAPTFFTLMRLNSDFTASESVALEQIFDEYITAFYSKNGTVPQLYKKLGAKRNASDFGQKRSQDDCSNDRNKQIVMEEESTGLETTMTVSPIFGNNSNNLNSLCESPLENLKKLQHSKPIKGLYPLNPELEVMANNIAMEIVVSNINVQWEDIIGYEKCKTDLCNTVFLPLWFPQIYSKKFSPCSSILLYGPPGTGKTMLAKAVATACKCTFFNITSSSIVSKWRGDSEKYIRVLFDLAAYWAPSVIFIDEIDWVTSRDSGNCGTSSDPARRFRAEFLARFDGLLTQNNENICLLAATNLPWTIDAALLRRFEKKILVNLPDEATRQRIFEYYILKTDSNREIIRSQLVKKTENYSCADIKLLCKEARITEFLYENPIESIGLNKAKREKIKTRGKCTDTIIDPTFILNILEASKPKKNIQEQYELWQEN